MIRLRLIDHLRMQECKNNSYPYKHASDYIKINLAAGISQPSSIGVCLLSTDNEQLSSRLVNMVLYKAGQVCLNRCCYYD